MRNKKIETSAFVSVIFPWLTFLGIYKIGSLSIENILEIICIIICLYKVKGKIVFIQTKDYLVFFLMITFLHVVALLRHGENQSWLANFIFCTLLISGCVLLFPNEISYVSMIKSYKIAGIVGMIGILIQSVQVYLIGQRVTPIVLFPRLAEINDSFSMMLTSRPRGFFSEPQAFVSFIFPLFIITLCKREWRYVISIALCIMLSTSSTGIIMLSVISFIWLLQNTTNIRTKIIATVLFIVLFYAFYNLDVFQYGLTKINKIDFGKHVRIINGFELFSMLSIPDKILGIGGGDLAYYFSHANIETYTSSFARLLIEYGIIGGIVFASYVLKSFKKGNHISKLVLIYFLLVSFSQTILFNSWQSHTLVIMYSVMILNNDGLLEEDIKMKGFRNNVEI